MKELEQRILEDMGRALGLQRQIYILTQSFIDEYAANTGRRTFDVEDETLFQNTMPELSIPIIYLDYSDPAAKRYNNELSLLIFALAGIDRNLKCCYRDLVLEFDVDKDTLPGIIYITQPHQAAFKVEFDPANNVYKCETAQEIPEGVFAVKCPSEHIPLKYLVPFLVQRLHEKTGRD